MMSGIQVSQPSQSELDAMGVSSWGIWQKEESSFPWTYDAEEVCYLLEGDVVVTTDAGEKVQFGAGDMVVFPAGLSCHWDIRKAVKKHYQFR